MVKLSVVIPAYNEYTNLHNNFYKIKKATERITKDCEIIIAEDGSMDGTSELAEKFRKKIKKNKEFVHLHADKRLGRGKALNRAFKKAKGKIVLYMDADLATDMKDLPNLVKEVEKGYDCVTGSRYIEGADIKREFKREFVSRIYNFLVRLFFNSKLLDHQCGFKAFKKQSLIKFIDEIENNGWFWDTELIVRAKKAGLEVKEVPIKWTEKDYSVFSLVFDVPVMALSVLRLWFKVRGMGGN